MTDGDCSHAEHPFGYLHDEADTHQRAAQGTRSVAQDCAELAVSFVDVADTSQGLEITTDALAERPAAIMRDPWM
jgi:hypothetical protein